MSTVAQVFLAMMIQAPVTGHDEKRPLKLTYFDIKGLAQATRDTFKYASIPFEDKRVSFDEFRENLKLTLPFGQLPVLQVGDLEIAQSKAILRYASKLARTYPKDAEHAGIIDQWCDLHTDFVQLLFINMYGDRAGLGDTGYCAKKHRAWILEHHVPKFLGLLESDLDAATWLGNMDSISMADFCWYPTLCWLRDGAFDGVTEDTFSQYPNLTTFMRDVAVVVEETDTPEPDATDDADTKTE
jgi:glutathione S-transferase